MDSSRQPGFDEASTCTFMAPSSLAYRPTSPRVYKDLPAYSLHFFSGRRRVHIV